MGTACLVQRLPSEALFYCCLCCCQNHCCLNVCKCLYHFRADTTKWRQKWSAKMVTHGAVQLFVQGVLRRAPPGILCRQRHWRSRQNTQHSSQFVCSGNLPTHCNLVIPHKPVDKSFKQFVDLVQTHYCLPPSVIVQPFAFNNRVQCEGKTATEFVVKLRKLPE